MQDLRTCLLLQGSVFYVWDIDKLDMLRIKPCCQYDGAEPFDKAALPVS